MRNGIYNELTDFSNEIKLFFFVTTSKYYQFLVLHFQKLLLVFPRLPPEYFLYPKKFYRKKKHKLINFIVGVASLGI